MTYSQTEADELTSPFDAVHVTVDPGSLEVTITDQKRDLRKLAFVAANFMSPQSTNLPMKVGNGGYPTASVTELHSAMFRLVFEDERYFPRGAFQLSLVMTLGSETLRTFATFSEHHHTRIVSMEDSLDPGGR
jgi:hypothetical protein